MQVVFGVPHVGPIKPYFLDTFLYLNKPDRTSLVRVENKAVDLARNMIVETFLSDPDNTHLFFMDSDMTFPGQALARLVERDKSIVSGAYFARTDSPIPHAYIFDNVDDKGRTWYRSVGKEFVEWLEWHPEEQAVEAAHVFVQSDRDLLEVDTLGAGCMLIKREVLEAIEKPWFKCWEGMSGGEDFYFCQQAAKAGFQSYVDFSVQCGHEAQMAFIGRSDFCEVFGIGTKDQYNFEDPILIEAGPSGRRVNLQYKHNISVFKFPDEVEGYVTYAQGYHLFDLAREIREEEVVVELGVYKGKSLVCMAQSGRRVYGIDLFEGEKEISGMAFKDHAEGHYHQDMINTIYGYKNIEIIQADTHDSKFKYFPDPVGLLYIDAAHDYESVKADFEMWSPHVVPDGLIALDDVNFPDVERFVSELGRDGWKTHSSVGTMVVLERRQA